jgi:hypothetical protein
MDQPGNRSTSQREHHQEHLWPSRQVNLLASSKVSRYNEEVAGESQQAYPLESTRINQQESSDLTRNLLPRRTGNPSASPHGGSG